MRKYVEQLEANQFFDYASWRFFPNERKIVCLETKRPYSTDSAHLLKSYGFIRVQDSKDGIVAKVAKTWGTRQIGFSTLRDTDVFFAMMRKYFGLAWQ
jgi:hypothetical protein